MKKSYLIFPVFFILILAGCTGKDKVPSRFDFTGPRDPSLIRGFNYTPANVVAPRHHLDCWVKYDSATIEFDMDLAKGLNLNQVRVFVPYQAYTEDSAALPAKLRHFVRTCHARNIGVMPVLQAGPWARDTSLRYQARNWARFLVDAISDEPGLAMWDVANEPRATYYENCKFMSKVFHELDPNTPVTIGMEKVDGMIEMADYVDVLQFHDYLQTREQIRNSITRAKEFAAKVNKPLINGEIGCIARANPYDITLQEHMNANVGWYIWELMIVRGGWGTVHGVFYEDGSVRDPSIAAAIMGYFRKRTPDILPAVPDNEGWITRIIERSDQWLKSSEAKWNDGLDIAETAAHLLESGELVAMRTPPTWEVEMLRQGDVDMKALEELIVKFSDQLRPYTRPRTKRN